MLQHRARASPASRAHRRAHVGQRRARSPVRCAAMSAASAWRSISRCISDSAAPSPTDSSLPLAFARDRDHRMHQHVHGDAALRQRHAHRVDQERHVVIDDLHDRVAGLDPIPCARIEHADRRHAGAASRRERQRADRDAGPTGGRTQGEFVVRHARVEGLGKGQRLRLPGIGGERANGGKDGVEGHGRHGLGAHETRSRRF